MTSSAGHRGAFVGATMTGLDTLLTMVHLVLGAFITAFTADVGTDAAQLVCILAVLSHE
jgi:hypothetical protein